MALALIPGRADAQTTGSIVGRIVDATGAGLAGADVRIDKLPHRVASGTDGRFVIGAVPAGERDLRIEMLGHKPVLITRIQVRPGRSSEVGDVRLETSPVEVAAIEVRADRQRLVEPEVSTTHEAVVGCELRELPVDALDQVLELTTGVSGGHFRGGRIGQEVYVVDGIELKNQLEASREGFGLELSPSSLEEVDVITGGFGAEYGSALSGVVSYTTRRGNPNEWESRLSVNTDQWAPASLFRGFTGLSLSTGGPISFLGNGATLFADVLAQGMLDADNRSRGLTCLTPDDASAELAAAITNFTNNPGTSALYCPYSSDIIPHQRGDKLIAFARFDKPISSTLNFNASILRNRSQNELYTSEFKYNPTYQLGQRFTGTLANVNAEWLTQKATGSNSFTVRASLMRLDRYLGVVDPVTFDGTEIAGFRPASFKFIGEEFARQDIIEQISNGAAIPGYIAPGGVANSPFGTAGAGIFFTEGTPTISSWSRSDVLTADIAAGRYTPGGSTYRAGFAGKVYRVETYERALAHLAGSMPNYARFFPATLATFGEANVQTKDGMHFQFGLRVEGFRSGIDFQADRSDFLSPVVSTSWKVSLMPRLGVAFPIPGMASTGIRFNYGRVAQPPDFRYFLDSTIGDSLRTDIRRQGNPNLAFEKGSSYEAGINHLFSANVALGITAFRKTLDNLVSGNLQLGDVGQAGRFSTGDFGSVNGIEVTARARWSGVSFRAGWAIQKATGLSSGNENDSTLVGDDPAKTEYPLAFDRRHSGDLSIFFGRGAGLEKPWSAALTTTVQSGYPLLRPAVGGAITGRREATQYLPWTASTDFRASYDFGGLPKCSACSWRIVFDGRNVFNMKNIMAMRTNTGTVAPSLQEVQNLANALPIPPESIPRESPAYVLYLDADRNGIITPQEAQAARFAAALDRFDPTLFFGEARQLRFGVEVTF
jgi:hypothetical protein